MFKMTDTTDTNLPVGAGIEYPEDLVSAIQRHKYNMLMSNDIDIDKLKFMDSLTKTDQAERKIGLGEDAIAATAALAQGIIASIKSSPFEIDPASLPESIKDCNGFTLSENDIGTFDLLEGELGQENLNPTYETLVKEK